MNYDGWITIGTKLETKSFDRQINNVEREIETLDDLIKNASDYKLDSDDVEKYQLELEKANNKLISLYQKKSKFNDTPLEDFSDSLDNLKGMNKGLTNIISKVGKWSLALIGVRTAYNFIRQATSTLAQYDNQIATDLEYMQYSLAQSLAPIIKFVISLMYKLMGLINAISKALFNVDLFANSTADNFLKAKNNAQDMKKSLAGFDTATILGSNQNINAQGNITPSYNFEQLTLEQENFIQKTKERWEKAKETFDEILSNPSTVKAAFDNWSESIQGIVLIFRGAFRLIEGVIQGIIGLIEILVGAITGDNELIKKGWDDLISGGKKLFNGFVDFVFGILLTVGGTLKAIGQGLWDGIASLINDMWNALKGLWNGIKQMGDSIWNDIISPLLNKIKDVIDWVLDKLSNIEFPSFDLKGMNFKLPTFKLPTLKGYATGAIINQPGRGVPIGNNSIGGEAGPEGLVPLTNEQVMEKLGETIGKYINLTINLTNKMDTKTVSKEVVNYNQRKNFARNGG